MGLIDVYVGGGGFVLVFEVLKHIIKMSVTKTNAFHNIKLINEKPFYFPCLIVSEKLSNYLKLKLWKFSSVYK